MTKKECEKKLLYALDHMTLKEVTRKEIAFDEEGSQ